VTRFQNYDPFGRPGLIVPPDGSSHATTLTYHGAQQVDRRLAVATGAGGAESQQTTTEIYDRQGRLYQVIEPAGGTATTYGYDPGNRLISVSSTGSGVTQRRSFTYDLRGFLTAETHPEKGLSGNGTVSYSQYDPRGHARQKTDGPNNLQLSYDLAERLTTVADNNNGGRLLKQFVYGSANSGVDYRKGKVQQASRFNYITLGTFNYTDEVRETYTYGGVGGRVSNRLTGNYINGGLSDSFTQNFRYDFLGNLQSQDYPQCVTCSTPAPRTVNYGYDRGRLISVAASAPAAVTYASTIGYGLNRVINQVVHGNGITDTIAGDPNDLGRPAAITAAFGSTPRWSTGTYAYDGAGDVKAIGSSSFGYDGLGRLTSSNLVLDAVPPATPTTRQQSYQYDAFGNLTLVGSLNTPTSPSTNRLTTPGTAYDAAGNMTTWNGAATYGYDALNQLAHFTSGTQEFYFLYTAEDERLWTYQVNGAAINRWTLRDLGGKVLREYTYDNNSFVWTVADDYIYRDGQLLAAETPLGVRHFSLDHLGTPRLVTNAAGAKTAYHVYYPYGQEATAIAQDTVERLKFTGHERDLANTASDQDDLDYMHAREASPLTGRFLSGDPLLQVGRAKGKPQLWNRYSYALNNPLVFVDPTGEDVSIALTFLGALSEQQKAELIRLITNYFLNLKIGNVFVFDAAKFNESNTSLFGLFSPTGVGKITIDANAFGVSRPSLVTAGGVLQDSTLSAGQKLQTIANIASHELLAHQFHTTKYESQDALVYARGTIGVYDPEVRARYGTVADHAALVDPYTRENVINGPIPIHAADLLKAQQILGLSRLDPPTPQP